jgi:hypothetical protein
VDLLIGGVRIADYIGCNDCRQSALLTSQQTPPTRIVEGLNQQDNDAADVARTSQLIDTLTGKHIWAERDDRVLEDIFAVPEEVTQSIVAAIAPQIELTERSEAARRRPGNLGAYEIALRATAHVYEAVGKAGQTLVEQAMREARQALAVEPTNVRALLATSVRGQEPAGTREGVGSILVEEGRG